jgi:signal transduction histidine kinase
METMSERVLFDGRIGAQRLRVSVSDEGAGIATEDRGHVFEKFYRADPSHRRVPGGTGLGLYISRELVERMGGSIELARSTGSGSTFEISLVAA